MRRRGARSPRAPGGTLLFMGAAGERVALAVHLMTNTAITGATYDIDGGQQYVS